MVNIIMPAYNAHKTIRQAIASVAAQDGQDKIKLTIVDDCSDEPYDYLADEYRYLNMEILRKPSNTGPGQARQHGIDRTDCEYMMFLDADDCLYCPDAVKKLLATIEEGAYDVVSSVFLEESACSGEYDIHRNDLIWMHGKIYRTQYIKERNIRFGKARLNEDNAFNTIILNTDAEICFAEYATYVWKNNKDSITRNRGSENYLADSIGDFIANAEHALKESVRLRAAKKRLGVCMAQYMITFYVYYLIFLQSQRSKAFLDGFIARVRGFCGSVPAGQREEVGEEQLGQMFYRHSMVNELISQNIIMRISIYDFMEMIRPRKLLLR
ncbi:MAG: glycosyltransferase [Oscillospiraceae bacterium]|nr:glycosyltransferase [Oscillospiraceae bacterium]